MRADKPLKEKVSITIDGDILEGIREQAEWYDRSLSQFINLILRDYLRSGKDREDLRSLLHGK